MTDAELNNAGPFAAHHCAESQHYKDEADKLRSLLGELDRSNESLTDQLESARRERDALATLLPKCAGTWDSGSGGHRKYLHDCDKPGVWDVGLTYVCDAHKNPNGGDADAWRWTEERDTLYSLRAAGGPVDALEMAVEGKLFAQALLSTARAEAEQLRAERDALAARICKRCNSCIGDCATLRAVEDTQNETAEQIAAWLDDWTPTVGEARSLICDAAKDPGLILFTTSSDSDYIGTTDISFDNTCLAIMAALRSGTWRTTKGDAGK